MECGGWTGGACVGDLRSLLWLDHAYPRGCRPSDPLE